MAYPFMCGLQIHGGTSRKLKIMAVAGRVPITKIVQEVIDHVYAEIPRERLTEAKAKLGIPPEEF